MRFTHSICLDWLLPGIPPTGKRVEVPFVAIVQFEGDKIAHEHLYWDQASVLVQVGLLDRTLPVRGGEIAAQVLNPTQPMNDLIHRALKRIVSSALSHVHKGFGVVRPYPHGPVDLPEFLQRTFNAVELERNEDGPTLLQIGDSLLWIEAGDLPPHVSPWVGSIYVYVEDVDVVYGRAIQLGAKSISPPEDKPYNERQAGFIDPGGNTWWVSTYKQMR